MRTWTSVSTPAATAPVSGARVSSSGATGIFSKDRVRAGELKLLLGTDAASEGLNLQRLGTLINIDLPWNPTRLEQRKGRIQRIGQARSEIWIANLRYRDSVEDRVHQVLADRLEAIHGLFGQIPDTLEDVWVQVALNDEQAARQLIDRTTATRNPFDVKYSKVEDADWETCASVLEQREHEGASLARVVNVRGIALFDSEGSAMLMMSY